MTDERLSRLAAEHLPADLAERWIALLRPCIRLRRSARGERTAAALGGVPELPAGVGWPEWQGHGPLSFVASVRCAELPHEGLAEEFPYDGTLFFFCYDGWADTDGEGAFVSVYDPESRPGAQVLYVPEGTPVSPAEAPEGLNPYPRLDLTAAPEPSAPDLWLPQVREALLGDRRPWPELRETPAGIRSFRRALMRLNDRAGHRIGGHAVPVQGPVEYEVANAETGVERPWGDALLDEEAGRWLVLAQFDSDREADMVWGDEGTLYWLIRPEDLTARRFGEARLVIQC
ncbi:YwqG family protein [Streptomyces sp. NPDC094448]|uniref:YwqG family protein n=1 Tax=Streptomyces sp. NPDC094448 TaxID=3366063 RepID=UPI003817C90E